MNGPARFAIVGSGWRAEFFLRLAKQAPDRFAVAGIVTRSSERGAQVEAGWGVPTFRSIPALLTALVPRRCSPPYPLPTAAKTI